MVGFTGAVGIPDGKAWGGGAFGTPELPNLIFGAAVAGVALPFRSAARDWLRRRW